MDVACGVRKNGRRRRRKRRDEREREQYKSVVEAGLVIGGERKPSEVASPRVVVKN